jgi:hypothetical protein
MRSEHVVVGSETLFQLVDRASSGAVQESASLTWLDAIVSTTAPTAATKGTAVNIITYLVLVSSRPSVCHNTKTSFDPNNCVEFPFP